MRFISVDGVVFDNQTACERHEKMFLDHVEMMDGKGNLTTDLEMATVVLLKSTIAADMFKGACEEAGSNYAGIDDNHGLYVWDGEDRYFRVDPAYIEGVIKGCYRLREEEDKKKKAEEERAQRERELREIVGAEDNK